MTEDRRTRRIEWGFRLLVLVLAALWLMVPPPSAMPAVRQVAKEFRP